LVRRRHAGHVGIDPHRALSTERGQEDARGKVRPRHGGMALVPVVENWLVVVPEEPLLRQADRGDRRPQFPADA
jgi:hypothetical protein